MQLAARTALVMPVQSSWSFLCRDDRGSVCPAVTGIDAGPKGETGRPAIDRLVVLLLGQRRRRGVASATAQGAAR